MYIIAGLGNPGSKYENTRHNIGWLAVDELAKAQGVELTKEEAEAFLSEIDDVDLDSAQLKKVAGGGKYVEITGWI